MCCFFRQKKHLFLWEVEVGSGVGGVGGSMERSCCAKEDALSLSSRQEEEGEQKVAGRDWEEEEELFW
jgi:hypothetical protein